MSNRPAKGQTRYKVPKGRWHQSPFWLELSRYQPQGLRLNASEDRALTAIQQLIYQRVTVNHERIIWQGSPDLPDNPWPDMEVPVLEITRAEYLSAYGLTGKASASTAFNALYRLAALERSSRTEPFRIRINSGKRKPRKASERETVALRRLIYMPIISRAQSLTVIPTPPLIAGLRVEWQQTVQPFFVRKENDLFARTRDFLQRQGKLGAQGELKTPTYLRFLYYLNTQAHSEQSTRGDLRRTRHQIREEFNLRTLDAVDDHLEFAVNMGYLTGVEQQDDDTLQLNLNGSLFPDQS